MPYKEKSQYEEFQRITILAANAGIPKLIIDDAMLYHKKISEAKTFRGCNRDGIIAATIYISCRINNYPRTSKEIACIFQLDHHSATKGCKNAIHSIRVTPPRFPMEPQLSKTLLTAADLKCSDEVISIVAMLSVGAKSIIVLRF